MFSGLSRCLGQGVRRTAGSLAKQAIRTPLAFEAMPKTFNPSVMRPFSVLGTNYMRYVTPQIPMPKPVAVEPSKAIQEAKIMVPQEGVVDACKRDSMVFEIGISFVVLHYQSIFIGVMRCLFQAFRPLLILFIFGQIIKAVFFIAGAPIWMSFYSIWLFEVTYGLAQCAISFIFISFFYNNLSFARIRPAVRQMLRQQKDKLAKAARALL
ncbi:Putative serine/threonine-protein kinase fhkA [Durusdinium trenchii]|uniref:Serine/threonine-protein kinase fhkA n=2 Tax=Durusdinium trenchii TaxID=1381693 RepID=A0ABP0ST00_9DINO